MGLRLSLICARALFRARQSQNVTAQSRGWHIARSALSSNGTRSGEASAGPNRARRRPRCSTALGPKSDAVTAAKSVRRRHRTLKHVSAGAVETGNGVTNEKADSLGSAVLVAACGVFVAILRNHAKIVRAHANRESPKRAARPFPVGSHSFGRCRHVLPSVEGCCTETVPKA